MSLLRTAASGTLTEADQILNWSGFDLGPDCFEGSSSWSQQSASCESAVERITKA